MIEEAEVVAASAQESQESSPLLAAAREGVRDSIPVCLTFCFMFFAIGGLAAARGLGISEAAAMTLLVYAAPLQVFLLQGTQALTLWGTLGATLAINLRFLVMGAAMMERFRGVPTGRIVLATTLMSVSTFTLAQSRAAHRSHHFIYFIAAGGTSLATAVVATIAGARLGSDLTPALASVVAMALPIHFCSLNGLMWGRWKVLGLILAGFVGSPLARIIPGSSPMLICLFVAAIAYIAEEKGGRL